MYSKDKATGNLLRLEVLWSDEVGAGRAISESRVPSWASGSPRATEAGLLTLLVSLLLPLAPKVPFPPLLAFSWGLADTPDLPALLSGSIWGNSLHQVLSWKIRSLRAVLFAPSLLYPPAPGRVPGTQSLVC